MAAGFAMEWILCIIFIGDIINYDDFSVSCRKVS